MSWQLTALGKTGYLTPWVTMGEEKEMLAGLRLDLHHLSIGNVSVLVHIFADDWLSEVLSHDWYSVDRQAINKP